MACWAAATEFGRLIVMGATTPGNSTILRTAMMIVTSSGIRIALTPGALAALACSVSRLCEGEDDAPFPGAVTDRIAPRRQSDAPLETALRELEPVDVRVAQLLGERAATADREHTPFDDSLDLIGVGAR